MTAQAVRSRRAPRRAKLASAAATVALALLGAGCAAGQQAQTANEKPTLDGANANVGQINLRGLAIQAPSGNFYPKGSGALLTAVMVNNAQKPDALVSITSSAITGWASFGSLADAQGAVAAPAGSATAKGSESVAVEPNARASYGTPDAKGGLVLQGLKQTLHPGQSISITFSFERAGTVKVTVPVELSSAPASSIVPESSASGQEQ